MFISKIQVENFRSFETTEVEFHEGINVLIGHNNCGKSNLLTAMALIFDNSISKQLEVDDFYNGISVEELKESAPKIKITITITQSNDEDLMSDELVTVSNWLVSLETPYQAQVQYEYFLSSGEEENYKKRVSGIDSAKEIWKIIKSEYIRLYTYKIWVGNPANRVVADSDSLRKFDYQFLNAIRDVERDMFSGRNTLLKRVIDFFMDYEIKSDGKLDEIQKSEKIKERKDEFAENADEIISKLHIRLKEGNQEILSYAKDIGASFDKSEPGFEGELTESELYSVLKLIIKQETGMTLPIDKNGLGYNNLIFMSLLLAKIQADSDGKYMGSNAKVFPMLVIEEPEAHLHPTMQDKFIKFLNNNIERKKVKQVFVTTHSTFIAAAVQLDDLICLYRDGNKVRIAYPGRTFWEDTEGKQINNTSKKYVQRFLDATKSNMLFAERIILVEGIAEQLLIPILAEYMGTSLADNHVAVLQVGGRYFEHFLKLFDQKNPTAINRKIACITDIDPVRKKKNVKGAIFEKCYPFEQGIEETIYEYKLNTTLAEKYPEKKEGNIRVFSQNTKFGKTLEYQLAWDNPSNELILTESISNTEELKDLMSMVNEKSIDDMLKRMHECEENQRIMAAIQKSTWKDSEKKKAIVSSRYLNSVGKGENALELASALKDNLLPEKTDRFKEFIVPEYIKMAIKWVCE
ncbi:MAG: AAA family ATPase [Lachnospiraceae bacterium]|jgi:predicted ATP-dependent endonuclease of OLD family|nr:AAA family ATPase [Lachnospiraceae bacterium]